MSTALDSYANLYEELVEMQSKVMEEPVPSKPELQNPSSADVVLPVAHSPGPARTSLLSSLSTAQSLT